MSQVLDSQDAADLLSLSVGADADFLSVFPPQLREAALLNGEIESADQPCT